MTRAVDPKKARGYITKAENSLRIAKIAIAEKAYDSAVMSCVHSAINALDAMTVTYLGKRASGSHTDVLSLIKGILTPEEYSNVSKQFSSLLGKKNASEYQPVLMEQKDAEDSVKWAERILNTIKPKLKI